MSRFNTQLLVDIGSGFKRVDLFENDRIVVTSKIQDIRDIKKVFTDYTQGLSVPGSQINNAIFRHAFRPDTYEIDTRQYFPAVFRIGNADFRTGYIQLNGAKFKSGRVNSYDITFYGALALLTQLFGDDYLRDLTDLENEVLTYNTNEEFDQIWLDLLTNDNNDNVRIALNSFDKGYIYDSDYTDADTPDVRDDYLNISWSDSQSVRDRSDTGVPLQLLKPSIREERVLQGIENTYNLQFSRGYDANNLPTSTQGDVTTNHFFGN